MHIFQLVLIKRLNCDFSFRFPIIQISEIKTQKIFRITTVKTLSFKNLIEISMKIKILPVNWSEKFHSPLLGDHLYSQRNCIIPFTSKTKSNPTKFDFWVVDRIEIVQLLHFRYFCHAENNRIIELKDADLILKIFQYYTS